MPYQLNFLEEEKTDLDLIKEEMQEVRKSSDKVRKGIYAKHTELARKYIELHDRMQIIEKNICTGESHGQKRPEWN